ncbi:MAG: hypothetical protein JWM82_2619 [Myxococcales bacterium]|nr:hypothetical protein [Myxococcales bacterium]
MKKAPARSASKTDALMISIGGLVGDVQLVGVAAPFVAQARERYAAFLLPPAPDVRCGFSVKLALEVPLRKMTPGGPGQMPLEVQQNPLTVKATDKTLSITRWDLEVRLRAVKVRGRTEWRGSGRGNMSPITLDCILRVIWSALLPREDAMLVHSCGLRHAAVGVVFPGVSGQGKSTLARKAPDADDVLSDEIIAIRRTPADGSWRVHGTPFWGDFARGGISLRSWPLRAIGFLAQRDAVVMSPVTSSDATHRLLSCMLCFQTDRPTIARNVALVTRLCGEVRCVEAQLTRTATTRQIFGRLEPHLGSDVHRQVPTFSAREMISELRALLRKQKLYAFAPKGGALRSFVKAGDSMLVESAAREELDVGDIVLYWVPGRTPDQDVLKCHRVGVPLPKGENWSHAEVLGRVSGLARDGRSIPVPGRTDYLTRLFGAQVAVPLLRMAGR